MRWYCVVTGFVCSGVFHGLQGHVVLVLLPQVSEEQRACAVHSFTPFFYEDLQRAALVRS